MKGNLDMSNALRTSEFWMAIISAVVTALVKFGVVGAGTAEILLKIVEMAMVYVFGRVTSKVAKAVFSKPSGPGVGAMVLLVVGLAASAGPVFAKPVYAPTLSAWTGLRTGDTLVRERHAFYAAKLGWDVSRRIGVQATFRKPYAGSKRVESELSVGLKIF